MGPKEARSNAVSLHIHSKLKALRFPEIAMEIVVEGYHFLVETKPDWNSPQKTVIHYVLHVITSGLLKCLCYIKKL